jgi:hypothetical protein
VVRPDGRTRRWSIDPFSSWLDTFGDTITFWPGAQGDVLSGSVTKHMPSGTVTNSWRLEPRY